MIYIVYSENLGLYKLGYTRDIDKRMILLQGYKTLGVNFGKCKLVKTYELNPDDVYFERSILHPTLKKVSFSREVYSFNERELNQLITILNHIKIIYPRYYLASISGLRRYRTAKFYENLIKSYLQCFVIQCLHSKCTSN